MQYQLNMNKSKEEIEKAFHEGYERGMKASNDITAMEIETLKDTFATIKLHEGKSIHSAFYDYEEGQISQKEFLATVDSEIAQILTTHSQNREAKLIEELRAFTFEACPYEGTMVRAFLNNYEKQLTPEQLEKKTYKEVKEEIRKTDYFKSLDEDGNPTPTEPLQG